MHLRLNRIAVYHLFLFCVPRPLQKSTKNSRPADRFKRDVKQFPLHLRLTFDLMKYAFPIFQYCHGKIYLLTVALASRALQYNNEKIFQTQHE